MSQFQETQNLLADQEKMIQFWSMQRQEAKAVSWSQRLQTEQSIHLVNLGNYLSAHHL
jgi:preprotein translocase subunit SecE